MNNVLKNLASLGNGAVSVLGKSAVISVGVLEGLAKFLFELVAPYGLTDAGRHENALRHKRADRAMDVVRRKWGGKAKELCPGVCVAIFSRFLETWHREMGGMAGCDKFSELIFDSRYNAYIQCCLECFYRCGIGFWDGNCGDDHKYVIDPLEDKIKENTKEARLYCVAVQPPSDVPESNVYVGLHWVHADNSYGGWICDRKATYVGSGKFESVFSLEEVVKKGISRDEHIKLAPVVFFTPDGNYYHSTFKSALEDAIAVGLVVKPSESLLDDIRVELAKGADKKHPSSVCKPDAETISRDSLICIDGSNVIGANDKLRTKTLQSIARALQDAGYKIRVFVDRSVFGWLRHKMNDEVGAEFLAKRERDGLITVAPHKAEADGQILQLAEYENNVHIITNDNYRDYEQMHTWLKDGNRLHGINIVPIENGRFRILIAGFNLDIVVDA